MRHLGRLWLEENLNSNGWKEKFFRSLSEGGDDVSCLLEKNEGFAAGEHKIPRGSMQIRCESDFSIVPMEVSTVDTAAHCCQTSIIVLLRYLTRDGHS